MVRMNQTYSHIFLSGSIHHVRVVIWSGIWFFFHILYVIATRWCCAGHIFVYRRHVDVIVRHIIIRVVR